MEADHDAGESRYQDLNLRTGMPANPTDSEAEICQWIELDSEEVELNFKYSVRHVSR